VFTWLQAALVENDRDKREVLLAGTWRVGGEAVEPAVDEAASPEEAATQSVNRKPSLDA
jgi:hypothetical protein